MGGPWGLYSGAPWGTNLLINYVVWLVIFFPVFVRGYVYASIYIFVHILSSCGVRRNALAVRRKCTRVAAAAAASALTQGGRGAGFAVGQASARAVMTFPCK